MYFDEFKHQLPDIDPEETDDWIASLDQVVATEGEARARFIIYKLLKRARQLQVGLPPLTQTRYINTISPEQEPSFPGDEEMERRIRRLIRWNAVAMVLRANNQFSGIGGHLATYASAATLYEVGFNHFFRGKDGGGSGDQIFYQGHAAPGIYARAFLEGRLSVDQLDHFRRETSGPNAGLSSYPHPRLMPDFWEYPTVSMGLGPLSAIYQARYNRYLLNRGLLDTTGSRVWAFLGDGETDEPETLGGLHVASREGLDNLTFVINCNLQRLDGPVRGNGKIIQELESAFRGAGWNVIKVIWGREWDELLARDVDGLLVEKMNETLDGEFQKFSVAGGAYIREHFFGPDPRLRKLVEHLSDDDLAKLRRGGHDYRKVYAAYKTATEHTGAPTVILAHTVKGWTLGPGVEARNITHQAKKLNEAELRIFRDRLELPIPDATLKEAPYYHPGAESEEIRYLVERRRILGGPLPHRVVRSAPLPAPAAAVDAEFAAGSTTPVSTTMVFARILRNLIR
ncbi:MAG TPA: pyruvate dehydrogenase (acetyl-transferring), homodimeric type, partial [Candidatus Limnocylindrales bacterium]